MSDQPTLRVFVFKDGLLSRLGHDLRLSVHEFELHVRNKAVTGSFNSGSLRVDGVMKRGKLVADGLSAKDKRKVEASVREQVLQSERFPRIELEARAETSGDSARVCGSLTLLGRRCALDPVHVIPAGTNILARTALTPSRWGVAPYKALAGALKVRDHLEVELTLPMESELDAGASHCWQAQLRA